MLSILLTIHTFRGVHKYAILKGMMGISIVVVQRTLNPQAKVRILDPQNAKWPHRLMVRTSPSQGGNTDSNSVGVTKVYLFPFTLKSVDSIFIIWPIRGSWILLIIASCLFPKSFGEVITVGNFLLYLQVIIWYNFSNAQLL